MNNESAVLGPSGPATSVAAQPKAARRLASLRVLLVLAACALLVAGYAAGIRRGLDAYIAPYAAGPFLHATCVVATKRLTGLGNYACLQDISDLGSGGLMYDLGLREGGVSWTYSSWDYLFDRQFVDDALKKLFAHPHWTVPPTTSGPPYTGVQGIGWGMDEGHASFVDLAYHVFGPSIEALYQAYWLVFGVSAAAFMWAYRRSLAPLALVLAVAVVEYMIFSTSFLWFTDGARPTTEPGNPRFLSCLCVVPILHFICAARSERPLTWRDAGPLVVQSLVLGLAMLQRTTILWVVLAALLWAAWYWMRRQISSATVRPNCYPMAALVIAVGALTHLYLHASAHPGIAANGYTSGHNFWFAMFYDLQTHPDWKRRYAAQYSDKDGDFLPDYAWRKYLVAHQEEWPRWNPRGTDPFQLGITQAGAEELLREALFEFARKDPLFVAQVWLVYNPRTLWSYTAVFIRQVLSWSIPDRAAVLLGIGLLCGLLAPRPAVSEVISYLPLTAFLCVVAVVPNLASLVIQESLSDYFNLLAIVLALVPVAVGAAIGLVVTGRWRRAVISAEIAASAC